MDLRQIMSFMSVYEERTFTGAARRTGIVQPALSAQIKRLEEEFGVPLFERGSRGVVPTTYGKAFYRLCEPIRRDVAHARQQMIDLAQPGDMVGVVRCGLPPTVFKAIVGPVIATLLAQHPHLDFALHEGFPATVSRWVLDGELDVGIGSWSADLPGLEQSMMYEEEVVLVSGVPLKPGRFAQCELADLNGVKLMVSSGRQLLGPVIADLVGSGRLRPAQTMIVESFLGIIGVARHSDWCAFVPVTGVLDDLLDSDLYFHRIKDRPLSLRWHVVHRRGEEMTKANQTFIFRLFDALRGRESRFRDMLAAG
jgi:LysR family transcriptional regulator, nitrogen assimilation regulatory protein